MSLLHTLRDNKKAQVWMMAVLVIILLVIAGVMLFGGEPAEEDNKENGIQLVDLAPDTTVEEGPVMRYIDGVEVERGEENLYPVAVMIENLLTVRPQSGLQDAQVVYESLAEGGITRFMAIYASGETVGRLGPVRSARHYFVDWAEEYGALYAHAGGSPTALRQLASSTDVYDLNEIGAGAPYFQRDSSLYAPHNLFTSSELMTFALRDNELLTKAGDYRPWLFASQETENETDNETVVVDAAESATTITLPFSSTSYEVEYRYNAGSNTYERYNGGVEHKDANTGDVIRVRNVVVQYAATSLLEADSGRIDVDTESGGEAMVFMNGKAYTGEWKYSSSENRTIFTVNGSEVEFMPGNIWVEVLPDDRSIEYTSGVN